MAITPPRPRRGTKGGKGPKPGEKVELGIYDIPDGDWDLKEVLLTDVCPNPFNDRDMGDLDQLGSDIKLTGLLEPVSILSSELFIKQYEARFPDDCRAVKEAGTKYVLGYGERRWRASGKVGLTTIKAIVRNDLIPTIRLDLIKENYHRKDPTEVEQARHIHRLVHEDGMTYREVQEALSIKSVGTVAKRIRLLELPPAVHDALEQKKLGVTAALQLLELDEEEQQLAALALIIDSEGKVKAQDAVHQILVHGVPAQDDANDADDASPEEPQDSDAGNGSESDPETSEAPTALETAAGSDTGEEMQAPPATPQKPAVEQTPRKKVSSPPAGVGSDRYTANKERELACVDLFRRGVEIPAEDRDAVVRRALLAGKGDARRQAHIWLVQSNRAHFDIKDTDSYFQAVLSSDDADLVELATFATALAANEARASDRRRPSWDQHDANYVRFLMATSGYVVETQWEKTELTRLGVSLGNARDPENLTDQESL
ncbi:ParB/RepB/Spo0J family partition protein [Streptomyces sp. NPDC094447]|uniref:ParB/RepB/Spo0J family partition protein n=1 Tax=Streptomyces sp. NPDC094447 TaxID=3366062 RepID=UPI00382EE18B